MNIRTQFTVGGVSYTLDVDEPDAKEALHQAIALANPRLTCNVCGATGADSKRMTTNRTTDGFVYIKTECDCGARSTLGEYRAGGFFWKEYEVWNPDNQNGSEPHAAQPEAPRHGQSAPPPPPPASTQSSESGLPGYDGKGPITPDAVAAISEQYKTLEYSKKDVQSHLSTHYGVDAINKLSDGQSRTLYRELAALIKKEVPF